VVELPFIGLKFEVLSAQLQALNCFFVFVYVPLFSLWLYPLLGARFNLSVKRKMAVGFALCALAFLVLGLVELSRADSSAAPTILWQVLAYAILTAAEVLVYWTGLEFSYTAAPRELKSFIMGLYLLSISLGNAFTALVNYLLSNYSKIGTLSDAAYLFLFAGIMAATTISFALFYERTAKVGKPA
jgi:POT family proton-dependent oligopeptide transporter